jgi:hypothetical protein
MHLHKDYLPTSLPSLDEDVEGGIVVAMPEANLGLHKLDAALQDWLKDHRPAG